MKPLPVYPIFDIEPVKGFGSFVWDKENRKYLDFYGGHAVISIGHSHPKYIQKINDQLKQLGFYSNSVKVPIQEEYAEKLGKICGYNDYDVFLCNSGAEAIENAIKVAAFAKERNKIVVFEKGFHGRTSMAVSCTDNAKVRTQFDNTHDIIRLPLNDFEQLEAIDETVCAVMLEGVLGIGGIHVPEATFLQEVRKVCDRKGALLILDEIQSGFGRTGRFFAHQHHGVKADIIAMAKGMGNGFPVAGVLVSPELKVWKGMLGSTFGGNHLACAAGLAVLEVMEEENLLGNVQIQGDYLMQALKQQPEILEVRGLGLMIGCVFDFDVAELRKELVYQFQTFTGSSSEKNVLRLLPPLSLQAEESDLLLSNLRKALAYLELQKVTEK